MGKYKKTIIIRTVGLLLALGCLTLAINSCSPVRRHARLVKNHPYVHTVDTIKQVDTVVIKVPKIQVDSIIHLDSFIVNLHDTITVTKDRLKVEIFRVKDSVFVNGKCDTVYIDKIITKKIPVKYYQVKENKWGSIKTFALLFIGLIFLILILIVVIKLLQLFK